MSRFRRLVEWCGFTHETWNTPIHQRLSNVVPTKAEKEATAALQAETALMVTTEPYGLSVMEEMQREYNRWPGALRAHDAMRPPIHRARITGITSE